MGTLALSLKKEAVRVNTVQMMEERGIIERCQVKAWSNPYHS
jgi:hypothetical protein